jgi:hypothetical protein
MSNIAEIILADGEVISISDFASENEFQLKLLNSLDFESIRSFFIKKTIVETVKEKHKLSNGSNGVSTIELLNLFKWKDLETYLSELEEKKIIQKRQGVNLEMYFVYKK